MWRLGRALADAVLRISPAQGHYSCGSESRSSASGSARSLQDAGENVVGSGGHGAAPCRASASRVTSRGCRYVNLSTLRAPDFQDGEMDAKTQGMTGAPRAAMVLNAGVSDHDVQLRDSLDSSEPRAESSIMPRDATRDPEACIAEEGRSAEFRGEREALNTCPNDSLCVDDLGSSNPDRGRTNHGSLSVPERSDHLRHKEAEPTPMDDWLSLRASGRLLSEIFVTKQIGGLEEPMRFYVGLTACNRDGLAKKIILNGGVVVSEPNHSIDVPRVFPLVDECSRPPRKGPVVYKESYVDACISARKAVNVEEFRLGRRDGEHAGSSLNTLDDEHTGLPIRSGSTFSGRPTKRPRSLLNTAVEARKQGSQFETENCPDATGVSMGCRAHSTSPCRSDTFRLVSPQGKDCVTARPQRKTGKALAGPSRKWNERSTKIFTATVCEAGEESRRCAVNVAAGVNAGGKVCGSSVGVVSRSASLTSCASGSDRSESKHASEERDLESLTEAEEQAQGTKELTGSTRSVAETPEVSRSYSTDAPVERAPRKRERSERTLAPASDSRKKHKRSASGTAAGVATNIRHSSVAPVDGWAPGYVGGRDRRLAAYARVSLGNGSTGRTPRGLKPSKALSSAITRLASNAGVSRRRAFRAYRDCEGNFSDALSLLKR